MGKLIDPERTRRARREREKRAARILEAARDAFVKFPYAEVSLDSIGQRAGVKQGQASLAFKSREELFMTVVRDRLTDWYDDLSAELDRRSRPITADELADLIAASLAARPDLTRLLGFLPTALELHEDGLAVHAFYRWQRQRLLGLADSVARLSPEIDRWSGFDALYRAQLVAAAVHPVSRPVGNLAVDLMAEDHQVFALDLEDEVHRTVLDTLG